jgi:hypothetical protein
MNQRNSDTTVIPSGATVRLSEAGRGSFNWQKINTSRHGTVVGGYGNILRILWDGTKTPQQMSATFVEVVTHG